MALQGFVQRALELFAPGAGEQLQPQHLEENSPLAQQNQAQTAIKNIANQSPSPVLTLAQILPPAQFSHPQANRSVRLGDATVAYRLERARRRSIGMSVGPEGLAVRAPAWVTLAAVDAALRDKGPWILRKLAEMRTRQQRQCHARIVWGDGALLPYLGQPLQVVLSAQHSALGVLQEAPPCAAAQSGARQLHIGLPPSAQPDQVRDAVQAWLMRRARLHFTQRLDHFAPQLQVRWTRLRLSSAQTRWGSARADGSISLNWRLLHYPQAIIDYVVVHELAHLRVMDHSPQFWSTVASVVPDHAALRQQLRDEPAPLWD